MALAATMVFECRTTGTAGNVNGGGYKPGSSGTDFSQQDAAQYDLTGVTTAAADAILLTSSAAADMVGNVARINSGTNFTVGWYEIISVVVGTSITLDRTCTTAAGSAGAVKIGGALNFGTADDLLFETLEPGNTVHVKRGTYTMSAVSLVKDGTSSLPIVIEGYNAARGDNPAFANQPILAFAANTSTFGDYWTLRNISATTETVAGLSFGTGCIIYNCKSNNTSVTASRAAFTLGSSSLPDVRLVRSEAQSVNGVGVLPGGGTHVLWCYIHDCGTIGLNIAGTVRSAFCHNIIDSCATAISTATGALANFIDHNTLYGAATPAGTGILLNATTAIKMTITNNIIHGFATGINSAAAVDSNFYDYNNFFNNTTDRTNVTAGDNDIALDPQFTDAPNGNFTPGTNMKITVSFPGGLTTTYAYLGAVQPNATGGSSGGARVMGAGIVSGG